MFLKKIDQCALSLLWETMINVHLKINIDSIGSIGMYRYSSILSVAIAGSSIAFLPQSKDKTQDSCPRGQAIWV